MEEWLNQLLDNSNMPIVTALVLGLLTAISPCPLATNITAVAYVSKRVEKRNAVFVRGLLYTVGRTLAYSILGFILIFLIRSGEETFGIQQAVSQLGENSLGPVLIAVGLFMLFGNILHLPKFGFSGNTNNSRYNGNIGALLLGMLFAMAFCPTSGLFYFGMLIPMSASESAGYMLPVFFSIATSLPVLVVSWIIAFSINNLGHFMSNMSIFQKWVNRMIGIVFIGVGIYYTIMMYI